MAASAVEVLGASPEYPISPKEHGVDFLDEPAPPLDALLATARRAPRALGDGAGDRGLLLRARVRPDRLADPDGFVGRGPPPSSRPTTSARRPTSRSPAAVSGARRRCFRQGHCFGPTFRAEKSKTRRHLTEFWMVEPEVAFLEFEGLCELAEDFVVSLVERLSRAAPRSRSASNAIREARGDPKALSATTYAKASTPCRARASRSTSGTTSAPTRRRPCAPTSSGR